MSRRGTLMRFNPIAGKVVEVGGEGDVRPEVDAPHVISDDIPPTVSHATDEGLVFTSKSALRAHYRQHGFEDTGGSHLTGRGVLDRKLKADRQDIINDIREAERKLRWGEVPLSEKEKEVCAREERAYREYQRRRR